VLRQQAGAGSCSVGTQFVSRTKLEPPYKQNEKKLAVGKRGFVKAQDLGMPDARSGGGGAVKRQ